MAREMPDRTRTKPARDPSHSIHKPAAMTRWIFFDDAALVVHYGQVTSRQVVTSSLRNLHEYNNQRRNTWRDALVNDFGVDFTEDEAGIYDVSSSAGLRG